MRQTVSEMPPLAVPVHDPKKNIKKNVNKSPAILCRPAIWLMTYEDLTLNLLKGSTSDEMLSRAQLAKLGQWWAVAARSNRVTLLVVLLRVK